jgi:hypothetical protein
MHAYDTLPCLFFSRLFHYKKNLPCFVEQVEHFKRTIYQPQHFGKTMIGSYTIYRLSSLLNSISISIFLDHLNLSQHQVLGLTIISLLT